MINAAASIHDPSLVRLLIANRADPNARTSQGVPVVLLALAAGNRGMVDALLAAKADPNQPGPQGLTLLHVAAMRGDLALAERLIAAGARPQPDAHGRMPGYYMFWLHGGDPAVAERLGYGEGRGYVERRERREREAAAAAEFAKVMLQATAAAVQQHQQARSAARQPAAGGPIQCPCAAPCRCSQTRCGSPSRAAPGRGPRRRRAVEVPSRTAAIAALAMIRTCRKPWPRASAPIECTRITWSMPRSSAKATYTSSGAKVAPPSMGWLAEPDAFKRRLAELAPGIVSFIPGRLRCAGRLSTSSRDRDLPI